MDQSLYSNLYASSNNSNDGNTVINTNEDTKSETSKRKRREIEYAYDDDSEYEERGDYDKSQTKRRAGRPKGSKNKPKQGKFYREEYIPPKPQIYEMPPFIPPTTLSCYSGSALEESYDEMIKVSENMSLISLKQECDARGCTYKRYKSIGKEELLFLLEPGTIAIHMTKVYNDLQILNRKLEGIKQENERIKTLKEEHRLQVLRDEEYMNQRQNWASIQGQERIGSIIEDEERLRLRQQEILRLDLQSRERLEREIVQFGRYPSNIIEHKPFVNNSLPAVHGGWIPPPIPTGYPIEPPLPPHVLTSFQPDLSLQYPIQYQSAVNVQQLDQASRLKLQTQNEMQRIIDENKKKLLAEGAFIRSKFHSKCNLFETSKLIKGCSADHLADWMLCNWCNEVSNYACYDCLWSICKKCNKEE
jgi:hypothetical protein